MRDIHDALRTSEVTLFRAHATNGRAFWRGFGLIQDDIYALVNQSLETNIAPEAGTRGTAWNAIG